MSHVRHNAVLVTAPAYVWQPPMSREVPPQPNVEAFRLSLPPEWRPLVVGPVPSMVNSYVTYAFLPDGSKEGWPESNDGDRYRQQFADLFAWSYEDGSSPFDVQLVVYGEMRG